MTDAECKTPPRKRKSHRFPPSILRKKKRQNHPVEFVSPISIAVQDIDCQTEKPAYYTFRVTYTSNITSYDTIIRIFVEGDSKLNASFLGFKNFVQNLKDNKTCEIGIGEVTLTYDNISKRLVHQFSQCEHYVGKFSINLTNQLRDNLVNAFDVCIIDWMKSII